MQNKDENERKKMKKKIQKCRQNSDINGKENGNKRHRRALAAMVRSGDLNAPPFLWLHCFDRAFESEEGVAAVFRFRES
ncbi:hypothetical protein TSUD_151600 [Trifolium subterraneum]|uniref:Uncharacterized protein n=1 Tax=Trifolium subterraneum TaxID=3900 RepID=A0A2Z6P7L2_TRISU|nr:hypothetical protein TSUD_151600 [Trifolium subterraneum]